MLTVSEIFRSIQGESRTSGWPCVFVRLSGCNLACTYCDTDYARSGGEKMSIETVVRRVALFQTHHVTVTGGEPLLQADTTGLLEGCAAQGHDVQVETNGALPLPANRDYRVIMDWKCPGSGMVEHMQPLNIPRLTACDDIKFVISDRRDFDYACSKVRAWQAADCAAQMLMGPVAGHCNPGDLAEWILASQLNVRLQLQVHRILWPDRSRGR